MPADPTTPARLDRTTPTRLDRHRNSQKPSASGRSPTATQAMEPAEPTSPDRLAAGSGTSTLRITYVGPNMELFRAAYLADHHDFQHESQYVRIVSDLQRLRPRPDVVLISPLVITQEGIRGACAVQAIVPTTTLVVALYTSLGSSHSMFTRHARSGQCHPRMLLHFPTPLLSSHDVVARLDEVARGRGGGSQIATTGHLPHELIGGSDATDLGQLMAEDAQNHRTGESLTFARLLYAAAVDPTWATWKDLANQLGFAEGHVKNTKAKLGRHLRNRVMQSTALSPAEIGVPRDQRTTWRIAEFTRFVTEHRSFIRSYCEHHLDFGLSQSPPIKPG